jgi:hypothetical protein
MRRSVISGTGEGGLLSGREVQPGFHATRL